MKRSLLLTALALLTFSLVSVSYFAGFLNPLMASNSPTNSTTANAEWRLVVNGFVQHSLNLTLSELRTMPKITVNATLYCVDSPITPIAKGNWTGVRLGLVLEKAEVSTEAVKIAFYAKDNYSTDLTVQTAMKNDIIVAYEKDGTPLAEKLRLVVPGKWGYKWISQLTYIEATNHDFLGTFESQGYSDKADISS